MPERAERRAADADVIEESHEQTHWRYAARSRQWSWRAAHVAYAQQSAPEQVPAFRSGVEAVSVEVGVVDKQGQPVRDLGAGRLQRERGGPPGG